MDLQNDTYKIDSVKQNEIEHVQKSKKEFHLLGTYLLTRGLRLYFYNPLKDEIKEASIEENTTLSLGSIGGKLNPIEKNLGKCEINNNYEYFQALNMEKAIRRANRFKKGKIESLTNLKRANNEGISFF